MMSAPSTTVAPNVHSKYAFLSKPPPPQKKRPVFPPPSPPITVVLPNLASPPTPPIVRSSTLAHIASWAALVQPGSPPPRSPRRRPSVSSSRRPSLTRLHRRPSISHSRAASGSFIVFADSPTGASLPRTATPSAKDFDLTALGYTSVFVHLPKTPSTPSPFLRQRSNTVASTTTAPNPHAHIPIPPIPSTPPPNKRTLKHFRSLILRPRSKSTSGASSTVGPSSPTKKSSKTSTPRPSRAQLVQRKKAAYAKHARAPPPLQNDLALMQFTDGGSIESHARRVMENQAKLAAGSHANGELAVGDVYRDGKGGIWWDAEEAMEYVPLLGSPTDADNESQRWVTFDASSDLASACSEQMQHHAAAAIITLAGVDNDRRGSVSTQDSDLNPAYLVEEQAPDDAILSRRVGMSVLSLPARPRRAAKHLRKPEFMVDLAAFGPRSPRLFAPKSPTKASSPGTAKGKGKARRRPAPLTLAPLKRPSTSRHAVPAVDARRDFIEDSFEPSPLSPSPAIDTQRLLQPPAHAEAHAPPSPGLRGRLGSKVSLAALRSVDSLALGRAANRKPSRMNVRALFGGKKTAE